MSDLLAMLAEVADRADELHWEGDLTKYLPLVIERPTLADRSHARIYRMIQACGAETDTNGKTVHRFFDGNIFGLEKQKKDLVDYFRAAAQGLEIGRRILLLMGPPAGGKSSIVTLLKTKLSEYSRTPEGAVYAIEGCPLHEDPLHLLPTSMRNTLQQEHGIKVEGDLCPLCAWRLTAPVEEGGWGGDPRRAKIVRVFLSEAKRMGIGTFVPSDSKSQDISELIGSIDLATIGKYGGESDPRAYRFDGELQRSNRGIMEFIEGLKLDEKFLYTLIPVAQERVVKAPKHPLISVDVAVIVHTNENEFIDFMSKPKNEALRDRMFIIPVPYNLRTTDEAKIYDRLIREANVQQVHVAPGTLEFAALFSILTRLDPKGDEKLSLVDKAKLYNGEMLEGWTPNKVKELAEKSPREGMTGVSPRSVIDALSTAMGQLGAKCISPITALRAIKDGIDGSAKMDAKTKEAQLNLLALVRAEFDKEISKVASRAAVHAFDEQANALVSRYLAEVSAWKQKDKLEDPTTGEMREPDEKWLRAIEEVIGVGTGAMKEFREEILYRVGQLAIKGKTFGADSHPRLKEAIEKRLYSEVRGILKGLLNTQALDEQQRKRVDGVVDAMRKHGYCEHCARELLRYAGSRIEG